MKAAATGGAAIRALPDLCLGIVSERLAAARLNLVTFKPRHVRGFLLLPSPALGERRHRGLAGRLIAVRWGAHPRGYERAALTGRAELKYHETLAPIRPSFHGNRTAMPDSPPAITDAHINRFRQRARFHFGISYTILFSILTLFGFAIYIFLFAQQIDRGKGSIQILQELLVAQRDQDLVAKVAEAEWEVVNQRLDEGTIDLVTVLNSLTGLEARIKLREPRTILAFGDFCLS